MSRDTLARLINAIRGMGLASSAPTSTWDADGRAVSKRGSAVQTPSRKSQGFDSKPPRGLFLETDPDRFIRRYNAAGSATGRLAVTWEAEQWLAHLHKRPPYRDQSTESLKERIRGAPSDVSSMTIAIEEGVSSQYVNRIRRQHDLSRDGS